MHFAAVGVQMRPDAGRRGRRPAAGGRSRRFVVCLVISGPLWLPPETLHRNQKHDAVVQQNLQLRARRSPSVTRCDPLFSPALEPLLTNHVLLITATGRLVRVGSGRNWLGCHRCFCWLLILTRALRRETEAAATLLTSRRIIIGDLTRLRLLSRSCTRTETGADEMGSNKQAEMTSPEVT